MQTVPFLCVGLSLFVNPLYLFQSRRVLFMHENLISHMRVSSSSGIHRNYTYPRLTTFRHFVISSFRHLNISSCLLLAVAPNIYACRAPSVGDMSLRTLDVTCTF
jgi:hypothetical protein